MNPNKKKNKGDVSDEVEELLRQAQDAALLKLSINSHTVHPSSSDIHPELEQRYRDLKSGSKSKAKPETLNRRKPEAEVGNMKEEVGDDDLFARFTALKASLPTPSFTDTSLEDVASGSLVGKGDLDDEEEDEVEKVIRWAKDAARLDPSPASDDDEDIKDDDYDYSDKSDEDDDSEKSDEDDDSKKRNKKGQRK